MKPDRTCCDGLTQARLKELLRYDCETGEFTRIKARQGFAVGPVKGFLDRDGYRRTKVDYKVYLQHRLAWFYEYGEWPAGVIDHINRDRTDNRIANMRDVSPKATERFCCDSQCLQGRDCPARRPPTNLVTLNRHKRWEDPYDDPVSEQRAKDFDHDEGPGMLSSRAFWGAVLAGWCVVGLGVAAWRAFA